MKITFDICANDFSDEFPNLPESEVYEILTLLNKETKYFKRALVLLAYQHFFDKK